MIHTDFYRVREDGVNLVRTYSDSNMMIRHDQTGNLYEEAIDVENIGHTYTETDIPIPSDEVSDSIALNIIMGREINGPDNGNDLPADD